MNLTAKRNSRLTALRTNLKQVLAPTTCRVSQITAKLQQTPENNQKNLL